MSVKKLLCLCVAFVLAVGMVGCNNSSDSTKVTLNLLNWDDYIDPELIDEFESRNPDIEVNMTALTSNEEMITTLSQDDSIYDMAMPSDYAIEMMLNEDLLQPIDKTKIPNFSNLMSSTLDKDFDKGNEYSVPYMWGTVGILYNKTMVNEPVTSWDILWDSKYSGNIIMYDSVRDSMAVSLKRLGYSLNTTNEQEIKEAGDELIKQKPLVQNYATDEIKHKMINNSAALSVVYSGDAILAMEENPDLAYVVPEEGSNVWFDNMVLMKNSQNTEAAYKFMDFLCEPDIAKRNSEYIGYTTSNNSANDIVKENQDLAEVYLPSEDILAKCESFVELQDKISLYDDVWTQLKSN